MAMLLYDGPSLDSQISRHRSSAFLLLPHDAWAYMSALRSLVSISMLKSSLSWLPTSSRDSASAQRANPDTGRYEGGGYFTTFAGFAPADDPQYVVAVDLERPTSSAEGGQVAAPVFRDILRYALTADGVVPSGTARPEFELTPAP